MVSPIATTVVRDQAGKPNARSRHLVLVVVAHALSRSIEGRLAGLMKPVLSTLLSGGPCREHKMRRMARCGL
jgi:hypothetical protein